MSQQNSGNKYEQIVLIFTKQKMPFYFNAWIWSIVEMNDSNQTHSIVSKYAIAVKYRSKMCLFSTNTYDSSAWQ